MADPNAGWEPVPQDEQGWEPVPAGESPTATSKQESPKDSSSLFQKGIDTFDQIAKAIPLSDRIKSAGFIGRGVEAIDNGIKAADAPHVLAKTASGALGGVPEFIANNPIAGAVEQVAKLTGAVPDKSIFPKSATPEVEKLGRLGEVAAAFVTALAPIGDKSSIAERITQSGAERMKASREAVANATDKIVEFDAKVRGDFFGARIKAGEEIGKDIQNLQKAKPDQIINISPAIKSLGVEVEEGGQITTPTAKLASDLKAALNRADSKTLETVLSDPSKAESLTLDQTQDIIKSIKKIPSFAQKLSQGKFANWTDTDRHIIQFIEDIRDHQIQAFPEFEKTLGNYREVMQKFRVVKPFFRETNLVSNITSDFQGKPVVQKFVRDLLPSDTLKQMENVRRAISVMKGAKKFASAGAKIVGGGLLAGAGFEG